MTHPKSSLEIVEEWKKKCYEFFTQTDDALASTMMRLLEVSSLILKGSSHSRVQGALMVLMCERAIRCQSENSKKPSIRTLMYGVLQSIHGTLLDMTSSKDSTPSKDIQAEKILNSSNSSLEIVEEWKKKCLEFYTESDDALASTMFKLLEAMFFILKGSGQERIKRALSSLESEWLLCLHSENTEEPSIRTMMYGVLQSVHGTLLMMTSSKDSALSEEIQAEEIPITAPSLIAILNPREEPIDNSQSTPDNEEAAEMEEDGSKSLDGVSMVPTFTQPIPIESKEELKNVKKEEIMDDNKFPAKPKEEPVDIIQYLPDNNKMHDEMDPILEDDNNEIISDRKKMNGTVESEIGGDDSSPISNEKEEVDEEEKTDESKNTRLKRKSTKNGVSESESAKKKPRGIKMNATDLKCPECEYRTKNVGAYLTHLRKIHSTSPMQAGLVLLCDCGNESRSQYHSLKCDIAHCVVVDENDGRIKRLDNNKITPRCVLCNKYPGTLGGYIFHLHEQHKSKLVENNIYLKCGCGFEFFTNHSKARAEHFEKCNSSQFTLHKLNEE